MRFGALRGLGKLAWVETKVFVREPMGVIGTVAVPAILFAVMGKLYSGGRTAGAPRSAVIIDAPFNVAILAALVIAIGAVQSLVTIIAIYREGGILKRLRATPLSPLAILGAHVVVKLTFTVVSLALLVLAGRQLFPGVMQVNLLSFALATLLSTLSILSLGFVIASLVPTARFAQPVGAVVLYPMLAISGLFYPLDRIPTTLRAFAYLLPTTHAVALLHGVWDGSGWSVHWVNAIALVLLFLFFSALSTRVFRWE